MHKNQQNAPSQTEAKPNRWVYGQLTIVSKKHRLYINHMRLLSEKINMDTNRFESSRSLSIYLRQCVAYARCDISKWLKIFSKEISFINVIAWIIINSVCWALIFSVFSVNYIKITVFNGFFFVVQFYLFYIGMQSLSKRIKQVRK